MNGSRLFGQWCNINEQLVGSHRLRVLTEKAAARDSIFALLDTAVIDNYDDIARLERWAKHLQLPNAAAVLANTLPTERRARSGHIGEILLTESVPELFPSFTVPIKRLRWLDGRNMALRGEDFIGIDRQGVRARFLKAESKSRGALSSTVVQEARAALQSNSGRPSAYAMLYVARRLDENGQSSLSLIFLDYTKNRSIDDAQLVHVLFTLSGNDSTEFLSNDLQSCISAIEQHAVGLVINDHADFIQAIYKRLTDAAQR